MGRPNGQQIDASPVESTSDHPASPGLFATFKLGTANFAIDVSRVQEIVRPLEITPVPLAQEEVAGLINLRGRIITAIDLGRLLALRPEPAGAESMNLVVITGEDVVSLLVDEVGDVLELDERTLQPVPPTLASVRRKYIAHLCELPRQLLLVLDAERL